jgi:RNA polymerase-binding transcription factor DksA
MPVASPSPTAPRLTSLTTEQLRQTLEHRRSRLIESIRHQSDESADEARSDDRAHRALADIERALARMRMGRYGSCARCGERLSIDRLAAAPDTRCCVLCS